MEYEIKVIRKNEHKISEWSGGTTTQLYIYPEESEYNKRNFLFRISSAKVKVEESLFTHLPGIDREIMILEGELELNHEGHHNIKLKKFEKDSFKGDWTTRSYGKVTDFNLMTNKECKGTLEHIKLENNEKKAIYLDKNPTYDKEIYILYVVSGKASVELKENIELSKEDLLVFKTDKDNSIEKLSVLNSFNKECHIIINKLSFN